MKDEPAFPESVSITNTNIEKRSNNSGLTKREYFAGLAMQGFCSVSADKYGNCYSPDEIASMAIKATDALIKELEK